jgi:hypothetical protein
MPLFVIERNFADQLDVTREDAQQIIAINDDVGVKWLFSFLSADKKKTYCLYEAPSAEYIRQAAARSDIPADVIVEVASIHEGAGAGRLGIDPRSLVGINVGSS